MSQYADAQSLREIKGSIADAIRERIDAISAHVKALNDHLATCKECETKEAPYRLCATGNRLFNAILEA